MNKLYLPVKKKRTPKNEVDGAIIYKPSLGSGMLVGKAK